MGYFSKITPRIPLMNAGHVSDVRSQESRSSVLGAWISDPGDDDADDPDSDLSGG